MKLGGLTWWRYNYGSILQAYALQEELNSRENIDYEIICQYGKKVVSVSNLKDKLARLGLLTTMKRIIWKFGLKKLRSRNTRIQKFIDTHLCVSDREYTTDNIYEANQNYDGFVCGSDQVWNPELVPMNSIYWLSFAEEGKLIFSYAPSIGVDCFTEEQEIKLRNNLKDFAKISVREKNASAIINKALGKECCVTVLDPVLMVDRAIWDKMSVERLYDEPYIFVYMLRGTRKQRQFIREFSKVINLKIVTMPFLDTEHIELYDFKFGDIKLWDSDPAEFISAIRYADYVITDSFHSMVFSCLYHRTFYTFPKIGNAQMNRIMEFQKLFEIPDRMIQESSTTDELLGMSCIDWANVDRILEKERQYSKHYLDEVFTCFGTII